MKLLTLALGALVLLLGNTLGVASATQHGPIQPSRNTVGTLESFARSLPAISFGVAMADLPQSRALAGGSVTPTSTPAMPTPAPPVTTPTKPSSPTPSGTPSPTPTSTAITYPDPDSLLAKTENAFIAVHSVRFENAVSLTSTNGDYLRIDVRGDATCTGHAMRGRATAQLGHGSAGPTSVQDLSFTQIKKGVWIKDKSTHHRWAKSKHHTITVLGALEISNPLLCSQPSGSTSTSTDQIKDLTDLGPDVFNGMPMWHLHGIDVTIDQKGNVTSTPIDFLISQDTFLPYVFSQKITDTKDGINGDLKQILTRFGEKLTVKPPKIGSTKP